MADNEPQNPPNPLWARQPGETDKAFEAFAVYRDLGPARSLTIAGRELGKSKATLERWCVRFKWVERVSAWDDEADRLSRERDLLERQDARRRMLDAHAKGGMELHAIGAAVLRDYDVTDPEHGEEAKKRIAGLTVAEAARIMEIGAKLERLARGETTERVELREAMAWVERFIDLALAYLPLDSHEAFLADVEARLGVGGIQG